MSSDDNTNVSNDVKKPMSEAERLKLAKKLDDELDAFIDGLERKRYEDGWPEDRWQEEMEKHPFFMKSAPQEGQEMSPLAQGLAQLKFDPDENTSLELALNYKEDGNFNFKHKNYRLAILGYTEGIKIKCGDPELEASLYNNRAASHWELKNYRSSLLDSEKALTFMPTHRKSKLRAARAALKISKYDTSIKHCEELLSQMPGDKETTEVLMAARKNKSTYERDQRKRNIGEKKSTSETDKLLAAIRSRRIRIEKCGESDDLELSALEPTYHIAVGSRVKLVNERFVWPVTILFPEFGVCDFIQQCHEDEPLSPNIEQLFPAPYDKNNSYSMSAVNVYYEGSDKRPHLVDPSLQLCKILGLKYFIVRCGAPSFSILLKNSLAEKSYLNKS